MLRIWHSILISKSVFFVIFLLLVFQVAKGQDKSSLNNYNFLNYSKSHIPTVGFGVSVPWRHSPLLHSTISLNRLNIKESLLDKHWEKNSVLIGIKTVEFPSILERNRFYQIGISYTGPSNLFFQIAAMYQLHSGYSHNYALMGGLHYETNRWIFGGVVRYYRGGNYMGEVCQGVSFHPSLEYAINDKFSIYSCMHISYLYLYTENYTSFSNTLLLKYKFSRGSSFFIGTETYFNPWTKRIIVRPTAGIESSFR